MQLNCQDPQDMWQKVQRKNLNGIFTVLCYQRYLLSVLSEFHFILFGHMIPSSFSTKEKWKQYDNMQTMLMPVEKIIQYFSLMNMLFLIQNNKYVGSKTSYEHYAGWVKVMRHLLSHSQHGEKRIKIL